MITIFDILKDVLNTKSGTLTKESDFSTTFNPYLVQRWVSMDSKENAHLVNETTNKLWSGLEDDKELWYKLYLTLLNKKNYRKIAYIKKSEKVVNEKREKEIEDLAKQYKLSKREVEQYLELVEYMEKE
jgi:hypothetical protein